MYEDEGCKTYKTRELKTERGARLFYEEHKNDADKFLFWVTKRDNDWEVLEHHTASGEKEKPLRWLCPRYMDRAKSKRGNREFIMVSSNPQEVFHMGWVGVVVDNYGYVCDVQYTQTEFQIREWRKSLVLPDGYRVIIEQDTEPRQVRKAR